MKLQQVSPSQPMRGLSMFVTGVVIASSCIISIAAPAVAVHECVRPCSSSTAYRKTCQYTFVVEKYSTLGAPCSLNCSQTPDECDPSQCVLGDGSVRMMTVANRSLPGPTIQVCEGDRVVVDVINQLMNGEGVSIHWHGLYQQGTPYMDGVSMITQCPIAPGATFRYNFTAYPAGTHWWHGHNGLHRCDGLYGMFVVTQPLEEDKHYGMYDTDTPEHHLVVDDWFHSSVTHFVVGLFQTGIYEEPSATIINGIGYNPDGIPLPLLTFHVIQGQRHRFRFVNSACTDTPARVTVDDHDITLIATDGQPFQPVTVDAFLIYTGETYDIILDANQETDNYWMLVIGVENSTVYPAHAIVRYVGAPDGVPTRDPVALPNNLTYQLWNVGASDFTITANQLVAFDNASLPQENLYKVYLAFDVIQMGFEIEKYFFGGFNFPMNERYFELPSSPPLTQFGEADVTYCPVDVIPEECKTIGCFCTILLEAELNQTIEIVLIDKSNSTVITTDHTFHLHGHSFYVLALEKLGPATNTQEVIELDLSGKIKRNFNNPPEMDTVLVQSAGYTVIQFVADNPGWWYFHCHFDPHQEAGMAIVIHVGDQTDLPPAPTNFPKCGVLKNEPAFSPTSYQPSGMYVTVKVLIVFVCFLAIVVIAQFVIMRSPWQKGFVLSA